MSSSSSSSFTPEYVMGLTRTVNEGLEDHVRLTSILSEREAEVERLRDERREAEESARARDDELAERRTQVETLHDRLRRMELPAARPPPPVSPSASVAPASAPRHEEQMERLRQSHRRKIGHYHDLLAEETGRVAESQRLVSHLAARLRDAESVTADERLEAAAAEARARADEAERLRREVATMRREADETRRDYALLLESVKEEYSVREAQMQHRLRREAETVAALRETVERVRSEHMARAAEREREHDEASEALAERAALRARAEEADELRRRCEELEAEVRRLNLVVYGRMHGPRSRPASPAGSAAGGRARRKKKQQQQQPPKRKAFK